MTYSSASDVFSYCRDILSGSTAFSASTLPTSTDVSRWITAGYTKLNRALASKGYSTPAASTVDVYEELTELEALYAAALAHRSRNTQQTNANATTKGDRLMDEFKSQLKDLLSSDLSMAGLTCGGAKLYAGGISIDDKQIDEDDSDKVHPAFYRTLHNDPEINWGSADTDDEETS